MDFDGKVVLVTGSSSGIGEATAHAFARRGRDGRRELQVERRRRRARRGRARRRDLRPGRRQRRGRRRAAGRDDPRAPRPPRRPRQQRRHDRGHRPPRPRGRRARRVAPHLRDERLRDVGGHGRRDGRAACHPRRGRERLFDRRAAPDRQLDPLRGVQGRAQPPDRPAREGRGPRGPGERRRARARRHALDEGLGRDPRARGRARAAQALRAARATWPTSSSRSRRRPT